MKTHKDLKIWQLGIELVKDVYKTTSTFPKDELYGLTSQLRRAAVSVPTNIAEGAARRGKKEFIHFLYIGLSSLSELETLLILAQELDYIEDCKLQDQVTEIRMKTLKLINYFELQEK